MSARLDLIPSQSDSAQIVARQVDRIVRSSTFRSSEVLRNLLSFQRVQLRGARNP